MNSGPPATTSGRSSASSRARSARSRRRAPRAPGDATLLELLALPVLMAGLSLLMWFSLPTHYEAMQAHGAEIEAAHARILEMARRMPAGGRAGATRCARRPGLAPIRYRSSGGPSNTEIIDPEDLRELGAVTPLAADHKLYLSGQLRFILYWWINESRFGGRLSSKSVKRRIKVPLAHLYVVLYGVQQIQPLRSTRDGRVEGAARVDAFLFERAGSKPLCELAFVERIGIDAAATPAAIEAASWRLNRRLAARLLVELEALTGGRFSDEEWVKGSAREG